MAGNSDSPSPDGQAKASKSSAGRTVIRLFILVLIIATAAAVAGGLYLKDQFERPGPLAEVTNLVIEPGSSVQEIASDLEKSGVISDARVFRLGVRVLDMGRDLKAGEFSFAPGLSMQEVAEHLRDGETVLHRVTIPEGLTSLEVVALVNDAPELEGEIVAVPAEGSLLPETYYFSRGDSREELLQRMAQNLQQTLNELWEARSKDLPLKNTAEAIVLASIVERETGVDSERPLVAGVFINRLRKGMRLQSDPTVVYGLSNGTGDIGRALTRKDLKTKHPYNTYVIDALPPGPIANPGRESIAAVLAPAKTEFFYFVADGSGGHAFAKTLDEHNKNVAAWRKFLKKQKAAGQN